MRSRDNMFEQNDNLKGNNLPAADPYAQIHLYIRKKQQKQFNNMQIFNKKFKN